MKGDSYAAITDEMRMASEAGTRNVTVALTVRTLLRLHYRKLTTGESFSAQIERGLTLLAANDDQKPRTREVNDDG